ncbi:hypothetical protein [Geomicrobium sediminis]|uniref:Uncharacterized protein n=1 Tax=Geomicrobium sediminis TaxID=1347788 RepID=A0ABS2P9B5_9BACL|nr:hypothetical protein [Geomicrobium sediminis]MBM7631998.1 hypothetical protein [Geomicrobium sediminis]
MISQLLIVLFIHGIAILSQQRELSQAKENDPKLSKVFYSLIGISVLLPTLQILGFQIPRVTVYLSQFMQQFTF